MGKTFCPESYKNEDALSSLSNEWKKQLMFIDSVVDELPVALGSVNRKDIENIAFFLKNLPPKRTIDEKQNLFLWKFEVSVFKKILAANLFFWKSYKKGSCPRDVNVCSKASNKDDTRKGENLNRFRNEYIKQRDCRISCFLVLILNVVWKRQVC